LWKGRLRKEWYKEDPDLGEKDGFAIKTLTGSWEKEKQKPYKYGLKNKIKQVKNSKVELSLILREFGK
jgi:hypothetical protein